MKILNAIAAALISIPLAAKADAEGDFRKAARDYVFTIVACEDVMRPDDRYGWERYRSHYIDSVHSLLGQNGSGERIYIQNKKVFEDADPLVRVRYRVNCVESLSDRKIEFTAASAEFQLHLNSPSSP